jgi:predicted house-cleaning noncanonical NTP pyrophosphatase (MazG superfamily)
VRPHPEGYPVKLVRDRAGALLAPTGDPPPTLTYRPLPWAERRAWLRKKLGEEVLEYLAEPSVEELAHVYLALEAAARTHGVGMGSIKILADRDKRERGGFEGCVAMYAHHPEYDAPPVEPVADETREE